MDHGLSIRTVPLNMRYFDGAIVTPRFLTIHSNLGLRGIWTYQGSTTDMQVSRNELTSMDGIFFEPCQNLSTKYGQFNPVWNTTVDHNVLRSQPISAETSKLAATATHINFTGDLQQTSSLIGTMSLNNQIYGNSIIGSGAEFFENDPAQTEGYCNYLRVEDPSLRRTQFLPCSV